MSLVKKLIIPSLVFVIIIIILAVFVIYPLLKSIRESSNELVDIKEELIFSEDRFSNFDQMKKDYNLIKPELEKINNTFVDASIPINLIRFWEEASEGYDVVIDISPVSLKLGSQGDVWESIAFQIIGAGSFPNFMKFIRKIESGPFLIEIKSLAIKKLSKSEIKSNRYSSFSVDDVRGVLSIKVFTK